MAKLFYDDEFDAQSQTITNSEKTFKEVAAFLFPHLAQQSQYARLKACVNPEKDERLTFGQIVAMCKFCKCNDALYFMCDELSHERPSPRAPEDELTGLLREYLEAERVKERAKPRIDELRTKLSIA